MCKMVHRFWLFHTLLFNGVSLGNAFMVPSSPTSTQRGLSGSKTDGDEAQQRAFSVGTLVEFEEKKRTHAGKIISSEHKSNGGARYTVEDHDGKHYNIADKAVTYAMSVSPDNERKVAALFDQFVDALEEPVGHLQRDLDITPDLLELAWEETLEDEGSSHEVTAKSLVELVHAQSASALEAYKAWRLLRTDMAHVFFKEIKNNGRVVAFKAKTEKAVQNAKKAFCTKPENAEEDLCWV